MNNQGEQVESCQKTYGIGIVFFMITSIAIFATSCSETNVSPNASFHEDFSAYDRAPSVILGNNNFSNAISKGKTAEPGTKTANMERFTSPLFGLATAPNGNILVADAGSGVNTLNGNVEITLPGITDISPIGRGTMWATKGLTGSPGDDTGQALYRISKGSNEMIADLFAFEQMNNPDGADLIDSNPFDVQSIGGQAALVSDAGGNDLLRVDHRGNIEVMAVFPNEVVPTDNIKDLLGCAEIPESEQPPLCGLPPEMPAQPVPTSIAVGPDGYFYVGELKGFPAPAGESNIWRISPDASWAMCGSSPDCKKVFDGGFTSIIDLAFDSEGHLYVTELDEKSWFAVETGMGMGGTINECDLDLGMCNEVATEIPIITAITFGNDGSLWATKNALIPGMVEVIEIE